LQDSREIHHRRRGITKARLRNPAAYQGHGLLPARHIRHPHDGRVVRDGSQGVPGRGFDEAAAKQGVRLLLWRQLGHFSYGGPVS